MFWPQSISFSIVVMFLLEHLKAFVEYLNKGSSFLLFSIYLPNISVFTQYFSIYPIFQ